MPETDIASAVASDLTNAVSDYSVDAQSLDSPGDQKEFTWQMTKTLKVVCTIPLAVVLTFSASCYFNLIIIYLRK
ncbi:hypothetical protein LCGC14_2929170 [marine sediment metagenome]|uniref:Uncharacterized protein n=1 Tax=marine sediment metagenome TaxID=412755 RepID=A0A0F8XLW5_9ZZZZ